MSVRPAWRRRLYSVDELAALADVDAATLERRLRVLGRNVAYWAGSGWRLTDPGWADLLGDAFADVYAAGGVREYRELAALTAEREPVVREPRGEALRPDRTADRERARTYASAGAKALRRVAGRWGEDELEVVS